MARKENSLGCISKRKDGRYTVSIMQDAKRHTSTCKTEAEANRLEQTLKYQAYPNIGHLQINSLKPDDVQAMLSPPVYN